MNTSRLLILAAMAAGLTGIARSAELKPETVSGWQSYLRRSEAGMHARAAGATFLWIDEVPDRAEQVRRGDIVVAPVVEDGTLSVPSGLIHHWVGGIFIPNATLMALLAVIEDHNRYKDFYKPVVVDSRSLNSSVAGREFSMTWLRRSLFVTAAMQAQYLARKFMINPRRGYSVVDGTRIQQIENYGRAAAHLLPPDTGTGFIWRIHSISRYEERDGGVYLEVEAIVLSRDIPASLRWMVTPFVNRLSVNSLRTTLTQTRQAVLKQMREAARLQPTT